MRKILCVFAAAALSSVLSTNAKAQEGSEAAPQQYENPLANPDPNFVPGDYPSPDVAAAQEHFAQEVDALSLDEGSYYVTNEDWDEITWTATKNGTATVMGYFRDFDGGVMFKDGQFEKVELVIDVNSLDSAVPARDNRLKVILLESQKIEKGTARLILDKITEGVSSEEAFQDGKPHEITFSGQFTLGETTVPVTVKAAVIWNKEEEFFTVSTPEPFTLYLSDLQLDSRVPELIKECNHASLGNAVKIACKLHFE